MVMCYRLGAAGPAVRNLAIPHDHEGFTTLWSSKSFAIMKFRSRVRIAAADRGSRAGNAGSAGLARPGTADPAARAGHPGFPQATVRTTSGKAVSRAGVLLRDASLAPMSPRKTTCLQPIARSRSGSGPRCPTRSGHGGRFVARTTLDRGAGSGLVSGRRAAARGHQSACSRPSHAAPNPPTG